MTRASIAVEERAARPQDRLPGAALPLHLADRPHRQHATCGCRRRASCSRRRRPASSGPAATQPRETGRLVVVTSPALERGRGSDARFRRAHGRPRLAERRRARRRRVRLREPRADRAATATASGSRTSARRTARYLNGIRLTARASWHAGDVVARRRDRAEVRDVTATQLAATRHGSGRKRRRQRGRLRRRAAAVRGRRRHGRRAGGRARLEPRRRALSREDEAGSGGESARRRADPGGQPPRLRARESRTPPPRGWARR